MGIVDGRPLVQQKFPTTLQFFKNLNLWLRAEGVVKPTENDDRSPFANHLSCPPSEEKGNNFMSYQSNSQN